MFLKTKGQFIKMHQTATYLANIFKQYPNVLDFKRDLFVGKDRAISVRLNNKGKYISTVDNISRMAKEFIDVYKNLPSKQSAENIRDMQNKIFFGKDGLFEAFIEEKPGKSHKVPIDFNDTN